MPPRAIVRCSPIGSPVFQYSFAIDSLMMTTGRRGCVSVSVNVRPRITGILKTSKYPGDAVIHIAAAVPRPLLERPADDLERRPKPPSSGTQHAALATSTPGTVLQAIDSVANRLVHRQPPFESADR